MTEIRCERCGQVFDDDEELVKHHSEQHGSELPVSDIARDDLRGSHGDQRGLSDEVPVGAGGEEGGPGYIGAGGPSDTDEHIHRPGYGDLGEGVESGETEASQMIEGLGQGDMGAVDPEIDLGTTLDTVDDTELVADGTGTGTESEVYEVPQRPESGLFECEVCGEKFFAARDLERHVSERHREEMRRSA